MGGSWYSSSLDKNARPYLKNNQAKRARGMTEVVVCLLSKQKALSLSSSPKNRVEDIAQR
jgi:hypothetical protein